MKKPVQKKIVVIMNGFGGVGKDLLVNSTRDTYKIWNISSVDRIKDIARRCGWKGDKGEKDRKFLADLKALTVSYNDFPYRYLCEQFKKFMKSKGDIYFAHIREPKEIEKFRNYVKSKVRCYTVLVQRDTGIEDYGNDADNCVNDYEYNVVFDNNGTIEESSEKFLAMIKEWMSLRP